MGSTKYVYVGPYLRIHRVLREVSIFANPHCCGSSYRGAECCLHRRGRESGIDHLRRDHLLDVSHDRT